ncbi:MAG: nitroreductase family protein [Gammaproteobacteria bacterium]|nr:nitroreductase family protein [Gammaproteobacteria bacterium]
MGKGSGVMFDLESTDRLLSTTRAVRKRLDLDRPVDRGVIDACLALALQAPTGSNRQGWRFLVVTDAAKRQRLAELYRMGAADYLRTAREDAAREGRDQDRRVFESAQYLLDNFHRVPVHVLACIRGQIDASAPLNAVAGLMGSIFPAVWSFQLALRSRGLGSCLTTLHLKHADEAARLLSIPDDFIQVGLLPVAYTRGTDFKPARRQPLDSVVFWEQWGSR